MLYLQILDLSILNLYTSTPNANITASPTAMPSTSPTMDKLKLNVRNI